MQPLRRRLAVNLMRAYGLPDRAGVEAIAAEPAPDEVIERVHAPAYVAAVRRYSDEPVDVGLLGGGPVGPRRRAATRRPSRACTTPPPPCAAPRWPGALAVWEGRADQALFAGGGLHHALVNRASGFCVYNDTGGRDPGAARRRRRARGLHRHRRPPRRRHAVDLLRGAARAHVLGARDRPLPVPGHRGAGRARRRRGRGHLPQRAAAALRRRPPLRARDRGGHRAGGARVRARRHRHPGRRRPPPRRPAGPPAGDDARLSRAPTAPSISSRARPPTAAGWRSAAAATPTTSCRAPGRSCSRRCSTTSSTTRSPRSWWSDRPRSWWAQPLPRRLSDDPEPEVPAEERARADVEGDRVVDDARTIFVG